MRNNPGVESTKTQIVIAVSATAAIQAGNSCPIILPPVRPPPNRAEERRPSRALRSRRTAARRRRAPRTIPTQSEDLGEFRTVSLFTHPNPHVPTYVTVYEDKEPSVIILSELLPGRNLTNIFCLLLISQSKTYYCSIALKSFRKL